LFAAPTIAERHGNSALCVLLTDNETVEL